MPFETLGGRADSILTITQAIDSKRGDDGGGPIWLGFLDECRSGFEPPLGSGNVLRGTRPRSANLRRSEHELAVIVLTNKQMCLVTKVLAQCYRKRANPPAGFPTQ